jgi:N-acetylglutamate synthase-like GNAT family acetyltransferase
VYLMTTNSGGFYRQLGFLRCQPPTAARAQTLRDCCLRSAAPPCLRRSRSVNR